MQQLLHTHTTMVRVSSSPAIINLSGFTVDIDAEPTRSSLPQRKAHKHIQLH